MEFGTLGFVWLGRRLRQRLTGRIRRVSLVRVRIGHGSLGQIN